MENEFSSRNSSKSGGVTKFHYIPLNPTLQCWILASLIYFPSNPNYSCIFSTSHIITKIKNLQLRKMTHFFFSWSLLHLPFLMLIHSLNMEIIFFRSFSNLILEWTLPQSINETCFQSLFCKLAVWNLD